MFSPLFSAFGPEPIKARMAIGGARALVTTEAFYRRKIEPWREGTRQPRSLMLLTECYEGAAAGDDQLDAAIRRTSK